MFFVVESFPNYGTDFIKALSYLCNSDVCVSLLLLCKILLLVPKRLRGNLITVLQRGAEPLKRTPGLGWELSVCALHNVFLLTCTAWPGYLPVCPSGSDAPGLLTGHRFCCYQMNMYISRL